jgi:carboxypeptidase PM20D1
VAEAPPGHSSLPPGPGEGAIGRLAQALARVDAQPLPGGVTGVAGEMFATLAPEMSGFQRLALSNLWLFGPVVERLLAKGPSTNALMRTTTAITIVQAGNKENVLPGRAEAVINFRILPGDSADSVQQAVQRIVADDRIQVQRLGQAFEPTRVSSAVSAFYRHIEQSAREVFAGGIVAPGLMLAATDGRHFEAVADDVYRFSPVRAGPADLGRFHGTDERISVDNLAEMIRFYHRLLQLAAGPSPTP